MKLTEHLYKFTGVEYETNSNIYGISDGRKIALIDVGYSDLQWNRMSACMECWGLAPSMVSDVFVTHSHFDHARNVWRVNGLGAHVHAGEECVVRIERGDPEMEQLFGVEWIQGQVDDLLHDGDTFDLPAGARLRVMETPGHCEGSLTFLVEVDGIVAAMTGDMFFVVPAPPEDTVDVELGYAGGSDFSRDALVESLRRLCGERVDILCPGHYYTYQGEHMAEVLRGAYNQACRMEG